MSRIPLGRWGVALTIVVLLAVISAAAFWLSGSSTIKTGPLEVQVKDLNFGEVWAQDSFAWKVPIRNTSSEDVEIVDFRVSCECTSIDQKTLVIPAASSVVVRLMLDLATGKGIHSGAAERPLSVDILPVLKGGVLPGKWKLRGWVKSAFFVTPASLEIKDLSVPGRPPAAQAVRVICHQALKDLKASCDESLASVEVQAVATGSQQYEVSVTPNPALPAGTHDFKVALVAVLTSGEMLPTVSFPVSVRISENETASH